MNNKNNIALSLSSGGKMVFHPSGKVPETWNFAKENYSWRLTVLQHFSLIYHLSVHLWRADSDRLILLSIN